MTSDSHRYTDLFITRFYHIKVNKSFAVGDVMKCFNVDYVFWPVLHTLRAIVGICFLLRSFLVYYFIHYFCLYLLSFKLSYIYNYVSIA